jgi:hypothetical protein
MILSCILWFSGHNADINIWERSSLLESILNGKDEEIGHDLMIDGKLFLELFYLVMG